MTGTRSVKYETLFWICYNQMGRFIGSTTILWKEKYPSLQWFKFPVLGLPALRRTLPLTLQTESTVPGPTYPCNRWVLTSLCSLVVNQKNIAVWLGTSDVLVRRVISIENWVLIFLLLHLYRARNKITQLSIPTHAQLQCHRLKFIKNRLKTPTCFGLRPSSGSYNVLAKITIILTTLRYMLSVVMWKHVVYFVSGCTWRASECTCSS